MIVVHGYLALARLQQARGDHAAAQLTPGDLQRGWLASARFVTSWSRTAAAVQAQLALAQGDLPLAARLGGHERPPRRR